MSVVLVEGKLRVFPGQIIRTAPPATQPYELLLNEQYLAPTAEP